MTSVRAYELVSFKSIRGCSKEIASGWRRANGCIYFVHIRSKRLILTHPCSVQMNGLSSFWHLTSASLFLLYQTFRCLYVVKIKQQWDREASALLYESFLSPHFIFHWKQQTKSQPNICQQWQTWCCEWSRGDHIPATESPPRASLWELLR